MSLDDDRQRREASERRDAIFRGAANQSMPEILADLHTSAAVIGAPLAVLVLVAFVLDRRGLFALEPAQAGLGALACIALAASMLLGRRLSPVRRWLGLGFGLPVFAGIGVALLVAATAPVLLPAKSEYARLRAHAPHQKWVAFIDRHAGSPEADQAVQFVLRNLQRQDYSTKLPPLVELCRRDPARHRKLAEALWHEARGQSDLRAALVREGLPLEASPP